MLMDSTGAGGAETGRDEAIASHKAAEGLASREGALLTIDVANARMALALWDSDRALHHWQLASDPLRPVDEYHLLLGRLFERDGVRPCEVAGCVVASVVPALTATIVGACEALLAIRPLIVAPGVHTGLRISTENPRELGADRIANAVAASARWGCPVVVIDLSTTLTIDVIGPSGDYLGAVIAPGMEIAADALARRTAQLRRTSLQAPPRAIAEDSEAALQSGLVLGYAGMLEGLIERIRGEVGVCPVVATGDVPWHEALLAQTDCVDAYEPHLTLDGLRRIHARQATRS